MVCTQKRVEWRNHLPHPAGQASFDTDQDAVVFLSCECTLAAHAQPFTHQHPQLLLGRAASSPFIPQPALISGIAMNQVKDLSLGLVEPHGVHMGPLLDLVKGITFSPRSSCTPRGKIILTSSYGNRVNSTLGVI